MGVYDIIKISGFLSFISLIVTLLLGVMKITKKRLRLHKYFALTSLVFAIIHVLVIYLS